MYSVHIIISFLKGYIRCRYSHSPMSFRIYLTLRQPLYFILLWISFSDFFLGRPLISLCNIVLSRTPVSSLVVYVAINCRVRPLPHGHNCRVIMASCPIKLIFLISKYLRQYLPLLVDSSQHSQISFHFSQTRSYHLPLYTCTYSFLLPEGGFFQFFQDKTCTFPNSDLYVYSRVLTMYELVKIPI